MLLTLLNVIRFPLTAPLAEGIFGTWFKDATIAKEREFNQVQCFL